MGKKKTKISELAEQAAKSSLESLSENFTDTEMVTPKLDSAEVAGLAGDSNQESLDAISEPSLTGQDLEDATMLADDGADAGSNAESDEVTSDEEDSEENSEGESEASESENELAGFEATNLFTEEETGFLPEATGDDSVMDEDENTALDAVNSMTAEQVMNSELSAFESAEIADKEFVEDERLASIIESIMFASDRPVSMASLKLVFKGTNVTTDKIRRAIDSMAMDLAGGSRGVTLEEVTGGYQLRTKIDNLEFMKRSLKARTFRLSGPALEVLAIVAYKQPVIKSEIDEIRGVESGHLLRALMEKNLVGFEGRADTKIGKPMQYGTSRKFLEIFGLRNLKELPTLSQIDELLPEGMTEDDDKEKLKLSDLTEPLSQVIGSSYSDGEEELNKVAEQLQSIETSSEFFEQEKKQQEFRRNEEKATNIREALLVGESVSTRDKNWLAKWELEQNPKAPSLEAEILGATTPEAMQVEAETEEAEESASLAEFESLPDPEPGQESTL